MPAPPVPCTWAPWWTSEEVRDFLGHVERVVQTRFGDCKLDEVDGTVSVPNMECVLGLSNLAQICRASDPADWHLAIYSHIARLDDFTPEVLVERLGDYERLKPDLRIRVVGPHHLAHIDPVSDSLPLGLHACLSVDLDGAACPVDSGYFNDWGVDHAEVMSIALANTLMGEPLVAQEIGGLSANLRVLTGDSLFVSGHLLDFARTVPDIGAQGAVVTVPTAQTVVVCPVDVSEQFVGDVASMLAFSYVRYLEGPNSVSPNALWWRPGHPLEAFACLDNQSVELVAPEPLRSRLRGG